MCTALKHSNVAFENHMAMCFVYTTMVLRQPADLFKEACAYVGADWLNSSVSQLVVRGQLLFFLDRNLS